ncbi:hypothetical protein [Pseudobutyrivibrio ruminis]|uniref:Dolichyl-phosphate-mannose-protein mannosyltransferase n=1 Tax=Pseudobutyrivibrio ruminis DSM 9787 TaxID=1123011 RepID=A0A285S9J0_9FIRM|nr:hypothetical protein [Pseudobutyrivibrio ruminis]SOC03935.1 hypothetical protein SAMN02910411_1977 [Pseudobutyrivibrio ruminis DSM 9787]
MKRIIEHSEEIMACTISFLMALLFGFNSPLHPWVISDSGVDSSVFKTIALMMEHGYMPYKDSFDHKGPLLYLLNWGGDRISHYIGIWIIEIFCISIAFYMLYKISRLVCGIASSIITSLSAVSLLFIYYDGGNLVEEYAMPCIAVGVYYFLDYLLNNVISKRRLLLSGLCCGFVLMLRPNMISIWLVYCTVISLILILKKEIKEWTRFVIWFSLGLFISIAPIVVWLLIKHDLYYCIQDYIIFNMRYSSVDGERVLFSSKWKAFVKFFNTTIYMVSFFCMIFHLKEKIVLNISYIIYLVLTIMLMVMSGMEYNHYGMILIPAVVYPLGLMFRDIEKIIDENIRKAVMLITSLYILSMVIVPSWINTIEEIAVVYEDKSENHIWDVTNSVVNMVTDLTDEGDKISVYGNWDIVYVLSDRVHATRYSYQFPIGNVSPEIKAEYMQDLQKEMPKVIVISPLGNYYDENIQSFLNRNKYTCVYTSDNDEFESCAMLFYKQ